MATSLGEITLTEERIRDIVDIANDWTFCNGFSIVEKEDGGPPMVRPESYTLFPSLVPAEILQSAKSTMVHFNRLMHKAALDHDFLEQSLKTVIEVDPFMNKLWNIYLIVRDSKHAQPLHVGLFRNDFMINCLDSCSPGEMVNADRLQLKQIEFNSISVAGGGLARTICNLHRLTVGLAGMKVEKAQMPENNPAAGLGYGLVRAWNLYGNTNAIIVFLVSSCETNIPDQRNIEFVIYENNPDIRVSRKTLLDVYNDGWLDGDSRLFINKTEVAVVYFRHAYTDKNYPSQKEWTSRLRMEMSRAIKCPSIQYQLAGTKKIQQELTRPGMLERFISDPAIVSKLRDTFAQQYSLELGPVGDAAVALALEAPDMFVLKPQREGGGNNLFGDNISTLLNEHKNSKERCAYILMQKVFPWQQRNYLVKRGNLSALCDVVCELEVYGVYIGTSEDEVRNYECGHGMKTKEKDSNEGGVSSGFGGFDTVLIV